MACVSEFSALKYLGSKLMADRFSSMPMCFPRMAFPKGCIARCTMRHGMLLMGPIMGSTGEMIGIRCQGLIATRLCRFDGLFLI